MRMNQRSKVAIAIVIWNKRCLKKIAATATLTRTKKSQKNQAVIAILI
jgi:hypothetical protein